MIGQRADLERSPGEKGDSQALGTPLPLSPAKPHSGGRLPRTLELRLRILTALERWKLGGQIAGVLVCSDVEREKCRDTAGRFYHAHARALSLAGDMAAFQKQIRAAVEAWPGIKGDLVEDRELAALWGG